MLQDMINRIKKYRPKSIFYPTDLKEAAVLIPIINKTEPELLLTVRANHLSTHSGEVAFPGGKREPKDATLQQTALRETAEEIALPAQRVNVIGILQTHVSKYHIKVTPFIALIDDNFDYQPNIHEISTIFTVPLSFFKKDPQLPTSQIDSLNREWYAPCYNYQQYKIWGLTAIMIAELTNIIYGNTISSHQIP